MKILHISNYFPPHIGGIEQTASDVMKTLDADKELKQELICFNSVNKNVVDNIDNHRIVRCSSFMKISSQQISISFKRKLHKEIKEFKPDLILFHFPNPLQSTSLMKELKKNPNIKLIVYYHLDVTRQKILGKFFKKQTIKLLKRADRMIASSPNYISSSPFLSLYESKCAVVPSMVELDRLKMNDEEKLKAKQIKQKYEGKKILFFMGRHVEYKGITYLIDANKYLNQEQVVIIIAGEGKLTKKLKKQAKEMKNIEFVGKLTDSEYRCYLDASDIFVFPSITRNEAFGLSLAEAMYFYKPAVTFHIEGSGVNYLNLDGVTGLEAKNSDSKDYASKINTLLEDEELYNKFSTASHERIVQLCMRTSFEKRIREIVGELK